MNYSFKTASKCLANGIIVKLKIQKYHEVYI